MIELGRPIKVFLGNLYYQGITVAVEDGRLRVGGQTDKLSPVYRDEIIKRREQLIDLLSPPVPDELRRYFGRLLRVDELVEALGVAERIDANLQATPVNGGWIVTMGQGPRPTVKERRKARNGA
jgi:hypothetical protein